MSGKNFMSFGDADTILTEFSNDIKSRVSTKANQGLTAKQQANAKTNIGIENVPNVATNDQTPTFLEESTRTNIASGDKLSLIFGKIKKFFSDLKAVAFSGSYNDLSDKPDLSLKADKTDIDSVYSVMGQMGAKNLIPYPYYHTSKTTAGITITDNGDGTLTFNGTSTSATVIFRLTSNDANIEIPLNKSKYILTWVDSAEHKRYFRIDVSLVKTDETTITVNGESGVINIDNTNGEYKGIYAMAVYTANNQTVSNLTFKPMLRLASDTDDTYQPYAKTNRQLTEGKAELESVRDYVNELGAKNLIPYPYYETTKTTNGITFTDNGDGSITVNGTATQNTAFYLTPLSWNNEEIKGNVILSAGGVPFNSNFKLTVETPSGTNKNLQDNGELSLTITAAIKNIRLFVANGTTVDNVTIYPMLRLASDINDDTYVQYAKTNKELTNDIDDVYKTMGEVGAKNLIPYPYYETTKTTNGITFTNNGDGTITANGTATGTAQFGLVSRISSNYYLPNGAYTVTGCPNTSGCQIRVGRTVNNADSQYGQDTGNGLTFTRTDATNAMGIALQIASGTTVSNLTFKPMLRIASDTDNTYQPYAMTNKQLTEQVATKQSSLTFDNVPTQNSNNPVKSGGIFSTMAVPKYDSANRREYYEGGAAFSGNIDSTPTAGSNNAVASGGTWSALNRKCSVATYTWNLGSVTAGGVYLLENFKNTVGLSDKNIVAVGLVNLAGSANYDYCTVIFSSNTVRIKTELTQNNATARLYIIYTD